MKYNIKVNPMVITRKDFACDWQGLEVSNELEAKEFVSVLMALKEIMPALLQQIESLKQ